MKDNDLFALVAAFVIANWIVLTILWYIINSATASNKKVKIMEAQLLLLAEMAKKQGVEVDEITKIINRAK